jgi:hypothetical protein
MTDDYPAVRRFSAMRALSYSMKRVVFVATHFSK